MGLPNRETPIAAERFQINIPQAILDDLNERLARARWPDEIEGAGWDHGTNAAYLRELAHHWQHHYNWRKHEADLNAFNHFRARIDGFGLHFIHERGTGVRPLPLLLTHGWPDSFWRFSKLIPMLTDPESFGGRAEDAFDVVVPSIPGFGFSDKPTRRGVTNVKVAELFAALMTELGYDRYAAHGGDWGRGVTASLGATQAASVVGIHLTDVPYRHLLTRPPGELSGAERAYLEASQAWSKSEGAYAAVRGTRPQTLAYGLTDSPLGLAGWLLEKFRSWSDCGGNAAETSRTAFPKTNCRRTSPCTGRPEPSTRPTGSTTKRSTASKQPRRRAPLSQLLSSKGAKPCPFRSKNPARRIF